MLHSYIAKPIVWRILQEVYLPVFMLSMLINHNKTRKLNAFSLPQLDAYLNCLVFNSISLYCGLIKNNAVDVGDNTSLDNEDKFHIQDISDKNPIITKFKDCYMDAYQLFDILS